MRSRWETNIALPAPPAPRVKAPARRAHSLLPPARAVRRARGAGRRGRGVLDLLWASLSRACGGGSHVHSTAMLRAVRGDPGVPGQLGAGGVKVAFGALALFVAGFGEDSGPVVEQLGGLCPAFLPGSSLVARPGWKLEGRPIASAAALAQRVYFGRHVQRHPHRTHRLSVPVQHPPAS
jgi:hypothetical protein